MPKKIIGIILCGGIGNRFDKSLPKQFFKINNETILQINLKIFKSNKKISDIIVVSSKEFYSQTKELCRGFTNDVVIGGLTRQLSVKNGLEYAKQFNPNYVLIHDSARPFINNDLINNLIKETGENKGCIPVIPITDSIKRIDNETKQIYDIERANMFLVQTPQSFPYMKILKAHNLVESHNHTDDSSIAKKHGIPISTIIGNDDNIKITTKNDIEMAELIFNKRKKKRLVTGIGFDVHEFEPGNNLIICGVKIPFKKKLKGHSDADVGYHALVDAMLGSISAGDIGDHFPPSEAKWKNKPSKVFVEFAKKLFIEKNAEIQNIDLVIICEEPKISSYKSSMKKNISSILNINENIVNIKGTTTEKLGFLGRSEGIAAQVLVSAKINET
jgi:2-C-methyl-D-erythritol 4-phosphate cytidylyltransferase / 2-C-methyl-D-erythritol 2,4-cyclodiphosphate synthase